MVKIYIDIGGRFIWLLGGVVGIDILVGIFLDVYILVDCIRGEGWLSRFEFWESVWFDYIVW